VVEVLLPPSFNPPTPFILAPIGANCALVERINNELVPKFILFLIEILKCKELRVEKVQCKVYLL